MREKKLFGTCGVRGPIETKVTPELAYRLALSLGTYIDGGKVAVARDSRTSGEMLQHAVTSGLLASGSDVVEIGLAPTPCLSFTTKDLGADAGVMITASHNPAPDNGIKFHNPDGLEYLPGQELSVEEIFFEEKFEKVGWDEIGSIEHYPDAIRNYVDAISDEVEVDPGLKVVVDCSSGASSVVTPYLLRELGCEVITLNSNPDGRFPAHSPEPQPWHLDDLKDFLQRTDADVGFAHDGDGDRVVAFDENGNFIKHDTFIALFAKEAMEEHDGGTMATSVNTSVSIEEVVTERGGELIRMALGDLPEALEGYDPIYAGEPGKSFFPDYNRWADGIYAASKLLELLSAESKPLSKIVSEVPSYPMHRENFPCPEDKKEEFMENAKDYLLENMDQIQDTIDIDGLRVNRENGSWILVRASGTEPKVRMVMEGKTQEELENLKKLAGQTADKFLNISGES